MRVRIYKFNAQGHKRFVRACDLAHVMIDADKAKMELMLRLFGRGIAPGRAGVDEVFIFEKAAPSAATRPANQNLVAA